jgi:hypothetical protein
MDDAMITFTSTPAPIFNPYSQCNESAVGKFRPTLNAFRNMCTAVGKSNVKATSLTFSRLHTTQKLKNTCTSRTPNDNCFQFEFPKNCPKMYMASARVEFVDTQQSKTFHNLKFKGNIEYWSNWGQVENILHSLHLSKEPDDPFSSTLLQLLDGFKFGTILKEGMQISGQPANVTKLHITQDLPYVHVNEDGPSMNYEFVKDKTQIFKCRFNSRPHNALYNCDCYVYAGPVVPLTLCDVNPGDLDLAFGIVVRVQKFKDNKTQYYTVLEVIMVPSKIALVALNWAAPHQQDLTKYKYSVHGTRKNSTIDAFDIEETVSFETVKKFLALANTYDDEWKENVLGAYNIIPVLRNTTLPHENDLLSILQTQLEDDEKALLKSVMPETFSRQYLPVVGIDIESDLRHAYECCAGAFIDNAMKQQCLLKVYKNIVCMLVANFVQNKSLDVGDKSSFGEFLEHANTNKKFTGNSNHDAQVHAHMIICSWLFSKDVLFPFGFTLNKFLSYEDEQNLLFRLMAIIYKLCKQSENTRDVKPTLEEPSAESHNLPRPPNNHATQLFHKQMKDMFQYVVQSVNTAIGNPLHTGIQQSESAMACKNYIEQMNHLLPEGNRVKLSEMSVEEYPAPCAIKSLSLPLNLSTITCVVDLSDMMLCQPKLFHLYKQYYPYVKETYEEKNYDNKRIKFVPNDICMEDRKFILTRTGRAQLASDCTDANTLFTQITTDLRTKKLGMHIMGYYRAPPTDLQPKEWQAKATRAAVIKTGGRPPPGLTLFSKRSLVREVETANHRMLPWFDSSYSTHSAQIDSILTDIQTVLNLCKTNFEQLFLNGGLQYIPTHKLEQNLSNIQPNKCYFDAKVEKSNVYFTWLVSTTSNHCLFQSSIQIDIDPQISSSDKFECYIKVTGHNAATSSSLYKSYTPSVFRVEKANLDASQKTSDYLKLSVMKYVRAAVDILYRMSEQHNTINHTPNVFVNEITYSMEIDKHSDVFFFFNKLGNTLEAQCKETNHILSATGHLQLQVSAQYAAKQVEISFKWSAEPQILVRYSPSITLDPPLSTSIKYTASTTDSTISSISTDIKKYFEDKNSTPPVLDELHKVSDKDIKNIMTTLKTKLNVESDNDSIITIQHGIETLKIEVTSTEATLTFNPGHTEIQSKVSFVSQTNAKLNLIITHRILNKITQICNVNGFTNLLQHIHSKATRLQHVIPHDLPKPNEADNQSIQNSSTESPDSPDAEQEQRSSDPGSTADPGP